MSDEQQMTMREPATSGTVALSSAAIDLSSNAPQSNEKQYPLMPKQPVPGKDKEPDFSAYGSDGVTIFSGIIDILSTGEYNPDFDWQKAIEIYDTMRRNDAQIAMLLRMVEMPIIRAKWSIKPGDGDTDDSTEIASFVDECLFKAMCYTTRAGRQAYQTWPEILHHILMMIAYGFSPFEIIYKKEDGWIKWARWTPLLPRTLYRWWVDEGNDLTGIQIWTWINYRKQYINIPADKLLLFVNEQEGNNFNGVSMLRAAYKHWFYKDRYYAVEAIGVERAAVQPPVIRLSPNPTGEEQALAQTIVQNIRVNEQMGIVLKHDMDAEILKGSQRQAFQTQPIIQHHDMLMARAFMAQFANLGSNETGSYALAQQQVQMFLAAFQSVIVYIIGVINREIKRLVIWNFGEQENYPELCASKLIAQDITTFTDAWKAVQAGNAPLITPSPELEAHVLDLMGLPVSKTHSIATMNPSSPTNPQRPEQNPDDHGDQEPQIQRQMRETTEEARLLRESMRHLDAVERGMQFFNPYHLPAGPGGGQFAPKGGGGAGGGEHVGTGRMGRGGIPGVTVHNRGDGNGGGGGARGKSEEGGVKMVRSEREIQDAVFDSLQRREGLRIRSAGHAESANAHPDDHVVGALSGSPVAASFLTSLHRAYGSDQLPAAIYSHAVRVDLKTWRNAATEMGIDGARRMSREELARSMAAKVIEKEGHIDGPKGHFEEVLGQYRVAAKGSDETATGRRGGKAKGVTQEDIDRAAKEYGKAASKAYRTNDLEDEQARREAEAKVRELVDRREAQRGNRSEEDIHATAHRLQQEQGLEPEVRPAPKGENTALTPQKSAADVLINRNERPTVEQLRQIYGEHQMGAALSEYSTPTLKEMARETGTDLKGAGNSRDAIISRITSHATEGRYSADFRSKGGETTTGRQGKAKGEDAMNKGDTLTRAEHDRAISELKAQHQAEMDELRRQIAEMRGGRRGSRSESEADRVRASREELQRQLVARPSEEQGQNPRDFNPYRPTSDGNLRYWHRAYGSDQLKDAIYAGYSPSSLRGKAREMGIYRPGMTHEEMARAIATKVIEREGHIDGPPSHMDEVLGHRGGSKASDEPKAPKEPSERSLRSQAKNLRQRADYAEQYAQHSVAPHTYHNEATNLRARANELERRADEMKAARKQGEETTGRGKSKNLEDDLKPIRRIEGRDINIAAPPNARFLRELYGHAQLGRALNRYTPAQVRQAAEGIGIKPGRSKADTIQRILKKLENEPETNYSGQQGGQG